MHDEYYQKPIVSLATGDFNGDGRDQLAFSVGFGNTSTDREDGYQEYIPHTPTRNYDLEYFADRLCICDYDGQQGIRVSSDAGASMSLWELGEMEEVTNEYRKYKTNILHNGAITAGDMDGDGLDEILAVGYTDHDKARAYYDRNSGKLLYVDDICNWNDSNLVYSLAQFNGSGYTRGEITRLAMNNFIKDGTYTEDDWVHCRVGLACAKTNGDRAPVDVFVAGDIYCFENGDASPVYQPEWFNNDHDHDLTGHDGDDASNQWY